MHTIVSFDGMWSIVVARLLLIVLLIGCGLLWTVRFMHNDGVIDPDSTPADIALEDDDVIECCSESRTISVQYKGDVTAFRMNKTTKMKKVYDAFATRMGLNVDNCEF